MRKQPNIPIGILRKFLIFLLYYRLLFYIRNFEELSRLLTDFL